MSEEVLETLTVHQTFLCVLHLANQYGMRLVPPEEGENDFAMFIEVKAPESGLDQQQQVKKDEPEDDF